MKQIYNNNPVVAGYAVIFEGHSVFGDAGGQLRKSSVACHMEGEGEIEIFASRDEANKECEKINSEHGIAPADDDGFRVYEVSLKRAYPIDRELVRYDGGGGGGPVKRD